MRKPVDRPRKLHAGHFALMRAVVQGVDARQAWDRYLRTEGEALDVRKANDAIAAMRAEFAAAAKRQAKPGTARLVLIRADVLDDTASPSLDAFAHTHGLENFSEAEQAEAYAEAFGTGTRRGSRRARLIQRQLEALQWLEVLLAEQPKAGDGVGAWLMPSLARRIESAGMPTLFALVERINDIGVGWWFGVPGIGALKAARITAWLIEHGLPITPATAAALPRHKVRQMAIVSAAALPPSTALAPLEKFRVPAELDGRTGRFRAARALCLLDADDDYSAIGTWLASKSAAASPGPLSLTQRAYRREAERLLLWAVLEAHKPLSSLTVEDAHAYVQFLRTPPAAWCGARHHQRWSVQWRPLEGPLGVTALRQALTGLRLLYGYLVQQNYLLGNPFAGVATPRQTNQAVGSGRALSLAQWDAVVAQLAIECSTPSGRRRDRAVKWIYATGLRLSEITQAVCEDLQRFEPQGVALGWFLRVKGKGGKLREVPLPDGLVRELGQALAGVGRSSDPLAPENKGVPILANLPKSIEPWSASGLYKAFKALLERCALRVDDRDGRHGRDAERLRSASPHWLRHSHASHALNGRPGHAPAPLLVIQNNLGHASLGTTSGYLHVERADRLRAMQEFWEADS